MRRSMIYIFIHFIVLFVCSQSTELEPEWTKMFININKKELRQQKDHYTYKFYSTLNQYLNKKLLRFPKDFERFDSFGLSLLDHTMIVSEATGDLRPIIDILNHCVDQRSKLINRNYLLHSSLIIHEVVKEVTSRRGTTKNPTYYENMVRLLLDYGVDYESRDRNGYLPIDHAKGMFFDDTNIMNIFKAHEKWKCVQNKMWFPIHETWHGDDNDEDMTDADGVHCGGGFHCGDTVVCLNEDNVWDKTEALIIGQVSALNAKDQYLEVLIPKEPSSITNDELVSNFTLISPKYCKIVRPIYTYKRSLPKAFPNNYKNELTMTKSDIISKSELKYNLSIRDQIYWKEPNTKNLIKGVIVEKNILPKEEKENNTINSTIVYTILLDDQKYFKLKTNVSRSDVVYINKNWANGHDDINSRNLNMKTDIINDNEPMWSLNTSDEVGRLVLMWFVTSILIGSVFRRVLSTCCYRVNVYTSGSILCCSCCCKACCPSCLYEAAFTPFRYILYPFLISFYIPFKCIKYLCSLSMIIYNSIVLAFNRFGNDIVLSLKNGVIETIRMEFDIHCAAIIADNDHVMSFPSDYNGRSDNGTTISSWTNTIISLIRSIIRIIFSAMGEIPLLIVFVFMVLIGYFVSARFADDVLGGAQTCMVVIIGCLFTFRTFYYTKDSLKSESSAITIRDNTLFCVLTIGPFGYLIFAKYWSKILRQINAKRTYINNQLTQFSNNMFSKCLQYTLITMEYSIIFVFNAMFLWVAPKRRIRSARSAWSGWSTIGILYYLSTYFDYNIDGGVDMNELMSGLSIDDAIDDTSTTLSSAASTTRSNEFIQKGPWYIAFGITSFVTLGVWTLQSFIIEQVNEWKKVQSNAKNEEKKIKHEKEEWKLLRQISNNRRIEEREKHMNHVRLMKGLECAHCHGDIATAINVECDHCILCMNCTLIYRQRHGNQCPLCHKNSTIKTIQPTLTECVVCMEKWESSCIFRPTSGSSQVDDQEGETKSKDEGCDHLICVSCMVDSVRLALKERSRFHTFKNNNGWISGLRCPLSHENGSGCKAMIFEQDISRLRRVSARVLPDDRSSNNTLPLTILENEKFKRFLYEARIPLVQRLYCINRTCVDLAGFRHLNDMGEDMTNRKPTKKACIWCGTNMCTRCHRSWHPNTLDCKKANKEKVDVTERSIMATTKPCPKCNYRVTHWHGHSCHHISPSTNGCPECHTHWCFGCGTTGPKRSSNYCGSNPKCRLNCVSNVTIKQHLLTTSGWPTDQRCGCAICPTCRPGKRCPTCNGSCVVCLGIVPPGKFIDPLGDVDIESKEYLPALESLNPIKKEKQPKSWFSFTKR